VSFVDTNVLVHASAPASSENARAITAIRAMASRNRVSISRQILREYVAVMTRPQLWGDPVPLAAALASASTFHRLFHIVEDGPDVWDEFVRLAGRSGFGGKQVHDANIVATMLTHGQSRLLTFNAKHFRRFEPLIEVIEP
jgi:predicted nucleic acid-binding protein